MKNRPDVLLVDEDQMMLKVFELNFRDFYNIQGVESPEDAINLIKRHHFDLVIKDFKSRSSNTMSFLARVSQVSPSTKTIILNPSLTLHGDVLNISYVQIHKPWNTHHLKLEIDKVLSN